MAPRGPWRAAARPRRRGTAGFLARWGLLLALLALPVADRAAERAAGLRVPTEGCRVHGVIDGDTVSLACPDWPGDRGRILGSDSPEVFSPRCTGERLRGLQAAAELRRAIWGARQTEIRVQGVDRYGRLPIVLRLDGADVAQRMVAAGLARPYDGGKREDWCP